MCSLAWVKQVLYMSHEDDSERLADISEQKQPGNLSIGGGTCVSCEDTCSQTYCV